MSTTPTFKRLAMAPALLTSTPAHALASATLALAANAVALRALVGFDGSSGSQLGRSDELFFDPAASSPRLVFGLALLLLGLRWARLRACVGTAAAPGWAALVLLAGSALAGWSHYVGRVDLLVPSASLLLVGLGLAWGGRRGARVLLLPAALVLLAFPVPRVLLNQILYPLQLATAGVTTGILGLLGVEVARFGELVVTSEHSFRVIESCSGLRSVTTLLMTALVLIAVFERRGRRAALLLLAAPVIGLLVNQLRILSIVASPEMGDDAVVHAAQGAAMMVLGVLALAGVDRGLGALARVRPRPEPARPGPPGPRPASGRLGPILATALALGLAAFTALVKPWDAPAESGPDVSGFPDAIGEWRTVARRPVDREFLGSVGFDRCANREFLRGGERVELLLCVDRRATAGDRMLSRKLWVPGSGWSLSDAATLEPPGWPAAIPTAVARSPREARLVAHWRVGARSRVVEILRGALGLDRGPLRRERRAVAVRVMADLSGEGASLPRARARLEAFLLEARPALADVGALDPPA